MQGLSLIFDGENFVRLMSGLFVTIEISFISIVFSIAGGLILGVLMSLKNKFIYIILKICLEIVRIMPQIVWLFIVYFGLSSTLEIKLDAISASIIVFSIWGVFEMMDLVRAAILSIPLHQFQSAASLGLKTYQIYAFVIVPLATRRLVPASINLLSRMIKTTSIVVLIGVVEVLKVAQQIIENSLFHNNYAPLIMYGFVCFLYFAICYPISKLSKILENRWA